MVRTRSEEPITIADPCPSQVLVPTCRSDTNSEDPTVRTLPIIKAFSVQCTACLKWRFIPSKEIYENIRQVISENPFVCEHASSWHLHASCNDPSDFSRDTNLLWVLNKPDIPVTPTGWERFLVFRAQGSVFADVYYRSPTGKRLRSMPEVERYLEEHPEHAKGISISQFSFVRPSPLYPDDAKKRKKCDTTKK